MNDMLTGSRPPCKLDRMHRLDELYKKTKQLSKMFVYTKITLYSHPLVTGSSGRAPVTSTGVKTETLRYDQ